MRSLFRIIRTRRRIFATGLLLVAGFVVAAMYFGRSRVAEEAYKRVQLGMTLTQVEAALGVTSDRCDPPFNGVFVVREREETGAFDWFAHASSKAGPGPSAVVAEANADERYWVDGDHMIAVFFQDGRVVSRFHFSTMPLYELWIRRKVKQMGF